MKKIWYPVVCRNYRTGELYIKKRQGWMFEFDGIKFAVQEREAMFGGILYDVTHLATGLMVFSGYGTPRSAIKETYKNLDKIKQSKTMLANSPSQFIEMLKDGRIREQ